MNSVEPAAPELLHKRSVSGPGGVRQWHKAIECRLTREQPDQSLITMRSDHHPWVPGS
jgi:hypothetical protein